MIEELICARRHAVPMVGYAWIRGQSNREGAGHANPPYELPAVSPLRLRRRPAQLWRQRVLRAVMIRQEIVRVAVGGRALALGQHAGAPSLPVLPEALEDVLVALLEIAALARILHHVEQELVARDPQILPVAL